MGITRKPGGGRKKLKPEYNAGKNLKEQMENAVALYEENCSLQVIGDELGLNPIKVRKLLITAGVYESEVVEKVKRTFDEYRAIKRQSSLRPQHLTFPKLPSPHTCHIKKVCTSPVQQKKRKSVLEQSGSGETEQ